MLRRDQITSTNLYLLKIVEETEQMRYTHMIVSVWGCGEEPGASPGPNRIHKHFVSNEGWGSVTAVVCLPYFVTEAPKLTKCFTVLSICSVSVCLLCMF